MVQIEHHQHCEDDTGDRKPDEDYIRLVSDEKPSYTDAFLLYVTTDTKAHQHSFDLSLLIHGSCVPVLHHLPLCVLIHIVLEGERLSPFRQRTRGEVFQYPLVPVVVRAMYLAPNVLRNERKLHNVPNLRVTRQTSTLRSSSR